MAGLYDGHAAAGVASVLHTWYVLVLSHKNKIQKRPSDRWKGVICLQLSAFIHAMLGEYGVGLSESG